LRRCSAWKGGVVLKVVEINLVLHLEILLENVLGNTCFSGLEREEYPRLYCIVAGVSGD
jgi:hypothetical protein